MNKQKPKLGVDIDLKFTLNADEHSIADTGGHSLKGVCCGVVTPALGGVLDLSWYLMKSQFELCMLLEVVA